MKSPKWSPCFFSLFPNMEYLKFSSYWYTFNRKTMFAHQISPAKICSFFSSSQSHILPHTLNALFSSASYEPPVIRTYPNSSKNNVWDLQAEGDHGLTVKISGDIIMVSLTPIYPVIWLCCSSLPFTSWARPTIILPMWLLSTLLPILLSQKSPPICMLASLAWPTDLPWIVTVKCSDSWLPLWHSTFILYDRLVRIMSLAPHLKHCSLTNFKMFCISIWTFSDSVHSF